MARIVMHIDLNAFFATAEELRHPELANQPIAVGGQGPRGVVSTANYVARKYGVHSAMPGFEAKRKCPDLVFLEPDFGYYEMLSRSFLGYLHEHVCPRIEQASIDECYVDLTDVLKGEKDPIGYFSRLQQAILKELGLKCSIGVAPTKFLAKMASDMKKPMGITILRKRDIPTLLYPLPVGSFFGIGKKTAARLEEMGVKTIGDLKVLCDTKPEEMRLFFGRSYEYIDQSIRGQGSDYVDTSPWDPKSLGRSETFPYDTDDSDIIEKKIIELANAVSEGAKHQKKVGRTVALVIRDKDFHTHDKSISFREPTDDADFIAYKAIDLYRSNFLGVWVRLVGVTLQNFADIKNETVQMSFWDYEKYEELDKTKLLVNEWNRRLKKPALKLLSEVKKDGK